MCATLLIIPLICFEESFLYRLYRIFFVFILKINVIYVSVGGLVPFEAAVDDTAVEPRV